MGRNKEFRFAVLSPSSLTDTEINEGKQIDEEKHVKHELEKLNNKKLEKLFIFFLVQKASQLYKSKLCQLTVLE